MAPKILLLHVSANASLLEHERAAQKFIAAADAVFFKAQGLAMLAPLHKTAFGLLEGLLDDWHLLNLTSIEWLHKAEVCQACINLWSLNKQAPWVTEFGKTVCDCCIADNMADHCWYLTGERPCWHCYHKSKGCLWNGVGVRAQKKCLPLSVLVMAKHVKLVQAAKAFLKWQGKSSQFFILEGYKGKGKAKALLGDSEQAGAKRSFKSSDLVDSDSDEEEEEDRVCVIKKIKREHVEELTGTKKRKEIIELDEEVEIVVPKAPVAGPSRLTSKPIVLVPSAPKPVLKPIIALASPVACPLTASIVSSSAPTPAAAAALSTPMPVKPASSAIKGGFVLGPFYEESKALIINQAIEVLVIQGTMPSEDSSDKDAQGDDDNSDDSDVAMDVDSAKHPEET
ncbi:hypothetical protein C0995_007754 [Termitomyces sp. Mi166|nr:hypothetical protein C0995_007754 [Termitomyces sp. Mi166\